MRPITPPAPEFPKGLEWINAEELSLSRLKERRVVVVSFINVSSASSIRALPRLKEWWRRYSQEGLLVVGVHTPDFEFDRDPSNVRGALKRLKVNFPVVLDNSRTIWKAYRNEGWPAYYLIDANGRIIHDHLGEDGYQEFELEILGALKRFNGYAPPPDYQPAPNPPLKDCGESTSPRYLGTRRGKEFPLEGTKETHRLLLSSRDGEIAYDGAWSVEPEALRLNRASPSLKDFIRLIYRGAEALAAIAPSQRGPAKVFVKQDDMWLHVKNAGPEIQWDKSERSFVLVSEPRLYSLTKNANDNTHELFLYPGEAGVEIHGFDFSNRCHVPAPASP